MRWLGRPRFWTVFNTFTGADIFFWWRRIHRLLDNGTLDVRLSLRTTDRKAARNMGAALTAVTPRVLEMLDRRAKQKTDITEQELQAIAKAMYEERLAEVCTLQRSTPYDVETHSAANLAFVDYFERLKNQGGRMSFLPSEERKLQAEGWSAQRITRALKASLQVVDRGRVPRAFPGG